MRKTSNGLGYMDISLCLSRHTKELGPGSRGAHVEKHRAIEELATWGQSDGVNHFIQRGSKKRFKEENIKQPKMSRKNISCKKITRHLSASHFQENYLLMLSGFAHNS